jgi:pyruvate dehydrogenase E1 component alpha subunit
VCAVENIAGHSDRKPDYHAVPNCIYTDPEIANVGMTEKDAREQGIEVTVGRFPLAASARALTLGQPEGAVKVVADGREGTILGVAIVGPRASDVIAEATLAVQQRMTVDELDLTIHAHPTMAESLLQAALAAEGRAIDIANPRRAKPAPPAAARASEQSGEQPKETAPVAKADVRVQRPDSVEKGADHSPPMAENGLVPKPEQPALQLSIDPAKLEITKEHRDDLLKLYRLMYLIRRFEERAQVEYTRAKIGGYCHLNLGEEATVVGGIAPLKPGDYIYTSYREHGHAIARGVDPRAVMAELFGRETGVAHGRGGSMHIFDYSHRFMGGYGIVGGHLPLATGAGFSIKYRKQNDVVFCMFGDGATNIGAFHESLNFSKVFDLPVVWFCINNQYGMGTAVEKASAVPEIYKKACAYDMESVRIDGMDLVGVVKKTHEIVEKTRADSQPRFIEAVNYRFKGHSVVDPDKYRSDEEKQKWLKSDPVVLFEHQLEQAKVATEDDFKNIRGEIEAEVDEVVKFADGSPNPPVEELYRFLYSDDSEAILNG